MTQIGQKHHDEIAMSDPVSATRRVASSRSRLGGSGRPQHSAALDSLSEQVSAYPHRSEARGSDPRHEFLDARAVMQRYGWGKTRGYQNLKNRELVPPPVMTHPDRWRLDQLLDWEDQRIAATHNRIDRGAVCPLPLECRLPGPKRSRHTSA